LPIAKLTREEREVITVVGFAALKIQKPQTMLIE
jgi:hypothetical protein